ncbi:MAG: polysaccharide biosynthesis protein [Candidatus Acidiferrales bacterium]
MMEENVQEAVKNNVFGLVNLLETAEGCGCESFILISSAAEKIVSTDRPKIKRVRGERREWLLLARRLENWVVL